MPETRHRNIEAADKSQSARRTAFFRSLSFPKAVEATKAKADYQNGMLSITVPIVPEPRAKRVDIKAA